MAGIGNVDVDCMNEAVRLLEGLQDTLVVLQMPSNKQVVPIGILFMIESVVGRAVEILHEAAGEKTKDINH